MRNCLFLLALCSAMLLSAQDRGYALSIVEELSSSKYHGRGYVNKGVQKAAKFISNEFKKNDVNAFGKSYFQELSFPMNTIPKDPTVVIDGKELVAGKDFVISCGGIGTSGTYELKWIMGDTSDLETFIRTHRSAENQNKIIVTNRLERELYGLNLLNATGIIQLENKKVWWHVSNCNEVDDYIGLRILKSAIPPGSKKIEISYKTTFYQEYKTQNVIGFVEGKKYPDRYIVFTAHYDHLGSMGKSVYFPGANDNGSGTAMVMDMARHYSQSPGDYSMVFILFTGEEAGLLGSRYFADNPLFDLEKTRFVVNLDMVGSGSDGITVVNGTVFKKEFEQLKKINADNNYLKEVKIRGESCNSDHCPFYEKDVPSIFIYTRGKECMEYHNIFDTAEGFPFTKYDGLFMLLTDFVNEY